MQINRAARGVIVASVSCHGVPQSASHKSWLPLLSLPMIETIGANQGRQPELPTHRMATLPTWHWPTWRGTFFDWVPTSIRPVAWRSHARRAELHQETYNREYYEFIEFTAAWSKDVMADAIVRDLAPRRAVDVGCGTGALLEALRSRAVEVTGLEYSTAALAHCHERGIPVREFDIARHRLPADLQRLDLAISFEVAEHLPARLANRFVKLLSAASDTIVMSAATPGQGGTSHLNEQPHEYWIQKMWRRGFRLDRDLSLRWRAEWRGKTADWYHANVMVFRRPRKQARAA
jgi:SAM-dependent methyltransferase